jgi:hypothetical protein
LEVKCLVLNSLIQHLNYIHLWAARAFLGLPKNVASFGLISELDWRLPLRQIKIKMIFHFGRLLKT